jgi:hypothetical protein
MILKYNSVQRCLIEMQHRVQGSVLLLTMGPCQGFQWNVDRGINVVSVCMLQKYFYIDLYSNKKLYIVWKK